MKKKEFIGDRKPLFFFIWLCFHEYTDVIKCYNSLHLLFPNIIIDFQANQIRMEILWISRSSIRTKKLIALFKSSMTGKAPVKSLHIHSKNSISLDLQNSFKKDQHKIDAHSSYIVPYISMFDEGNFH